MKEQDTPPTGSDALEEVAASEDVIDVAGAFINSLKRNNAKLRDDRAQTIARSVKLKYKRQIEDLESDLIGMQTERTSMLDVGHTSTETILHPRDFKVDDFVTMDINLGVKIRNTQIKLDIARKQFFALFKSDA